MKNAQKIAEQIKELVDQLVAMSSSVPQGLKFSPQTKPKVRKGASGALSTLIEEGFFDSPKDLAEIMSKLQQIGHWHKKPNVAMNLLNLTKRRIFNRIKDNSTKKWRYVIRR